MPIATSLYIIQYAYQYYFVKAQCAQWPKLLECAGKNTKKDLIITISDCYDQNERFLIMASICYNLIQLNLEIYTCVMYIYEY